MTALAAYQGKVDAEPDFAKKSSLGKRLFSAANKKGSPVFDAVKLKLKEMCSGAQRCVYCEDSYADEVEHIYPKSLYPEHCFSWDNYIYVCGQCNVAKNNNFAVFRDDTGLFEKVNPKPGTVISRPPPGIAVLINPRTEDAMDYLFLDLGGTFEFVNLADEGTIEYDRADYTLNTILGLNDSGHGEALRIQRRNYYGSYSARLAQYNSQKEKDASDPDLKKLITELQGESHPTVWKEIQRHFKLGLLEQINKELNNLFLASPEALTW
ncbi:MAG: HNH endonuclease [Bacteroidota bacterium]